MYERQSRRPAFDNAEDDNWDDWQPSPRRPKWNQRGVLIALAGLAVLVVVSAAILVLNQTDTTQDQQHILQTALIKPGMLMWGGDTTLGAPGAYVDPARPQTPAGLDADLITALAQRLHLQAQFAPVVWAQFPRALQSRTIDLFAGDVVTTTIPKADAIFTSPYLIMSTAIVVRAGDTRFTDLKSLEGHLVGVISGDPGVTLAKSDAHVQVQNFGRILPFDALASGRIDAVIINSSFAQWYGARDALKRFVVLPHEYDPAPVALALAPSAPHASDLRAIFSQTLSEMAQDGTLAQILQHWGLTDPLQQCITAPTKATGCPTP
ncbi:MAG TPA: ABC transporter substrate-binding protein [Ktedonobacterales bacterium]|nr:ABC transporter substrate-binding protein [Ktedonobacterales bacterium]